MQLGPATRQRPAKMLAVLICIALRTSSTWACIDGGNRAADSLGRPCGTYFSSQCGTYDDSDFTSAIMCCACGGGSDLDPLDRSDIMKLSMLANRSHLDLALRHWQHGGNESRSILQSQLGPIAAWDVSAVTDMNCLFCDWPDFDEEISLWNTSSVTDMEVMFAGASSFNQPIGAWDTSSVTGMSYMFRRASAFNQPRSLGYLIRH
eukprot:TRINITY_DN11398_c0_g2_i1.p1 TRINITY_DN11398_c0_g2~~TRINITY_DN11398_c0_g2_i1.p1  ORF type:complete len:213 (-),score=23.06 TRINITY_DN11398_c0_g2_i1:65-682(-)